MVEKVNGKGPPILRCGSLTRARGGEKDRPAKAGLRHQAHWRRDRVGECSRMRDETEAGSVCKGNQENEAISNSSGGEERVTKGHLLGGMGRAAPERGGGGSLRLTVKIHSFDRENGQKRKGYTLCRMSRMEGEPPDSPYRLSEEATTWGVCSASSVMVGKYMLREKVWQRTRAPLN